VVAGLQDSSSADIFQANTALNIGIISTQIRILNRRTWRWAGRCIRGRRPQRLNRVVAQVDDSTRLLRVSHGTLKILSQE